MKLRLSILIFVTHLASLIRAQKDECCQSVIISTSGPSNGTQNARIGVYNKVDVYFDRPVYQHEKEQEFLFYMGGRSRGLWMVGPKVGTFNGGLANRADHKCVENVDKVWKFADGSGWKKDPSIKVKCRLEEVTECFYADNSLLEGDEHHLSTIQITSTGQCIDQCVRTPGCRYWSVQKVPDKTDDKAMVQCFLKKAKGVLVQKEGFISGSLPSACYDTTSDGHRNQDASVNSTHFAKERRCSYRDLEFVGKELGVVSNLTDFHQCKDRCSATVDCAFFTIENESCILKGKDVQIRKRSGVLSGASEHICDEILAQQKRVKDGLYDENEINGKFKIISEQWSNELEDKQSIKFKDLTLSLKDGLIQALENDKMLMEQADFNVDIVSLRKGSVVCNFRIRYILKDAFLATPFKITPSNVTGALDKTFHFRQGVLFQRFVIASGSFLASSPVDHCDAKGCSHKCAYDYDQEDYVCTCPPLLQLDPADNKTCLDANAASSTTISPVTISLLPVDCHWSEWSSWSACHDCREGIRTRTRKVMVPASNGGICYGHTEESSSCLPEHCAPQPTDGSSSVTDRILVGQTDQTGLPPSSQNESTDTTTAATSLEHPQTSLVFGAASSHTGEDTQTAAPGAKPTTKASTDKEFRLLTTIQDTIITTTEQMPEDTATIAFGGAEAPRLNDSASTPQTQRPDGTFVKAAEHQASEPTEADDSVETTTLTVTTNAHAKKISVDDIHSIQTADIFSGLRTSTEPMEDSKETVSSEATTIPSFIEAFHQAPTAIDSVNKTVEKPDEDQQDTTTYGPAADEVAQTTPHVTLRSNITAPQDTDKEAGTPKPGTVSETVEVTTLPGRQGETTLKSQQAEQDTTTTVPDLGNEEPNNVTIGSRIGEGDSTQKPSTKNLVTSQDTTLSTGLTKKPGDSVLEEKPTLSVIIQDTNRTQTENTTTTILTTSHKGLLDDEVSGTTESLTSHEETTSQTSLPFSESSKKESQFAQATTLSPFDEEGTTIKSSTHRQQSGSTLSTTNITQDLTTFSPFSAEETTFRTTSQRTVSGSTSSSSNISEDITTMSPFLDNRTQNASTDIPQSGPILSRANFTEEFTTFSPIFEGETTLKTTSHSPQLGSTSKIDNITEDQTTLSPFSEGVTTFKTTPHLSELGPISSGQNVTEEITTFTPISEAETTLKTTSNLPEVGHISGKANITEELTTSIPISEGQATLKTTSQLPQHGSIFIGENATEELTTLSPTSESETTLKTTSHLPGQGPILSRDNITEELTTFSPVSEGETTLKSTSRLPEHGSTSSGGAKITEDITTLSPVSESVATSRTTSHLPIFGEANTTEELTTFSSILGRETTSKTVSHLPALVSILTGANITEELTTLSPVSESVTTQRSTSGQPDSGSIVGRANFTEELTTLSPFSESVTTLRSTSGQSDSGSILGRANFTEDLTTLSPFSESVTTLRSTSGQPDSGSILGRANFTEELTTLSPVSEGETTLRTTSGQPDSGSILGRANFTEELTTLSPVSEGETTLKTTPRLPELGPITSRANITEELTTFSPFSKDETTSHPFESGLISSRANISEELTTLSPFLESETTSEKTSSHLPEHVSNITEELTTFSPVFKAATTQSVTQIPHGSTVSSSNITDELTTFSPFLEASTTNASTDSSQSGSISGRANITDDSTTSSPFSESETTLRTSSYLPEHGPSSITANITEELTTLSPFAQSETTFRASPLFPELGSTSSSQENATGSPIPEAASTASGSPASSSGAPDELLVITGHPFTEEDTTIHPGSSTQLPSLGSTSTKGIIPDRHFAGAVLSTSDNVFDGEATTMTSDTTLPLIRVSTSTTFKGLFTGQSASSTEEPTTLSSELQEGLPSTVHPAHKSTTTSPSSSSISSPSTQSPFVHDNTTASGIPSTILASSVKPDHSIFPVSAHMQESETSTVAESDEDRTLPAIDAVTGVSATTFDNLQPLIPSNQSSVSPGDKDSFIGTSITPFTPAPVLDSEATAQALPNETSSFNRLSPTEIDTAEPTTLPEELQRDVTTISTPLTTSKILDLTTSGIVVSSTKDSDSTSDSITIIPETTSLASVTIRPNIDSPAETTFVDKDPSKVSGGIDDLRTLKCHLTSALPIQPGSMPMECKDEATSIQPIYVLISSEGLDLESLSKGNIKIVVKDYMLMEMQRQSQSQAPRK